jgi:mannosyltransferase
LWGVFAELKQANMVKVFVTNFNKNFTGVSATAANVVRRQAMLSDIQLVGRNLPGCPDAISVAEARKMSRSEDPFAIWHVRRNTEMRAAIWARDVLRLPIRIVFTSAAQRLHSWYPRQLIARMDAVIATTKKAAEFVPHVKAVVPHGVDTELFCPAGDRASEWSGLGYGGRTGIAAVGRIRPEKGTDRFVDAMIDLLPKLTGTTALVIGRAGRSHEAFQEGLKRKVDKAGLSDRIIFTGEIPADRMPRVMRAASLLVALPRYEGYGMTPLEAMASGTPFVASDTGFFREFSGDGASGSIVDPGRAASEIEAILTDSERYLSMVEASLKTAIGKYSIEAEVSGIAQVYDSLLADC